MIVIYGIRDRLNPIKAKLSDVIQSCMTDVLTLPAFFKIVVTSCLLIKQPLFLDLDERYQLVCSS